nr:hypothetical protein [Tanacetum cinerariifolium]
MFEIRWEREIKYRQLRIVLSIEDKSNYLEQLIPPALVAPVGQHVALEILAAYIAWIKGSKEIARLMLMTIEPKIQRDMENLYAHEMLLELKTLFAQQVEQELLQTTRDFHSCKQEEGQSVSSYVLKIKGYIDNLERMGHPVTIGLGVGLILIGLCKEYDGFVQNYNMQSMGKTVNELHAMLKLHEQTLPKKQRSCSSCYSSRNKRSKIDLDSALLWHFRLGHISKKRIKKLQHGGLLNSTDLRIPKGNNGLFFLLPTKNKVLVAQNVEFLKNSLITQEASGSLEDLEIIQEEDTHPSIDTSLNHEEDEQEIDEPQRDHGEPANYKAALLDLESDKWLNAMNVEMQSIKDNEVWVLVELPPNGKTVGTKWLFRKKTDMDEVVHTYKAHLVAKGYTQTPRIDYEETFSPVTDIRAIRILRAIAAYYDYEIWQMDVKTTFLNVYLDEEVYMEQPEGFVNPKYPNRECKLKRSIYRLKQASRKWNKRFDDEIKKFGFTQNHDEPCIYLKANGSNITFLIFYVDDILIMGNNIPMLQDVKSYLGRCFAIKDLGEAAYILEIKIYGDRSRRLISLRQSAYIKKILKRYYMENSKRGSIPMKEKLKLSKSQGASTPAKLKRMQNVLYALAVGSIMYAVRCTHLDVAFAQNVTRRFQQNPCDLHWTTVNNILKYLRYTKDMFLVYGGDLKRELKVSCYTDAGYLTNADDLKKFIFGLGVVPTIKEPISMYCDNTGAIAIANESGITKGARHFRAKVHYLCEVIKYGDIKLEKVHTYDNLADPFTKALAFLKHSEHTRNIEMLPASSHLIVLSIEDKSNYLEQPIPPAPVAPVGQHVAPEILTAYIAWIKGSKEIAGLMLMTMKPKIQRNLENLHAHEMQLIRRRAELVVQGLRASRKLKPGDLSLYVGNGQREAVQAIGLFLFMSPNSILVVSNKRAKLDLDSALLWHYRLGHISKKRIEKLQHGGLLSSTDLRSFEKYVSCISGKMARKPYTRQVERAKDLLGLLHTDVCGPFKITSRHGANYFVTFTDDFCCYGYVYMLNHKHEVFETFKVFQKEVENQRGKTIKLLRSDREGENKTLLDIVRSMTSQTTLPKSFWDYALETAACILNMVPTKKVEKTPYEVWHGQAPKLSYLKVQGGDALVKRDTLTKPDKLEPRSIKCIFIGYPKETMGYSFYYPPKNKVLVARNAEFLENSLITQKASGSLEDLEIILKEDTHPSIDTSLNHEEDEQEIDEPQSDINPIRRSTRTRHAPDRMCLYIDAEEHELGDLGEPANYVYFVEQCAHKVAPIRSPTGIEAGLGEHLAPIERPDKIPIEDQDGYEAWFANRVWRWRVVAPPPTHLIAIPILISSKQPIPPVLVAPAGQQVAPEILAAHKQELLQTTRDFHSCRQEERQSVSSYVLKMKGYIDNLERLGHPVTLSLGVSLILIGLHKEYDGFVQNYNMHSIGKTVNELHAMLKLHKQTLTKSNARALNAIRAGKVQKGNKHKKSHS